jgi:hypothetical protein
VTGLPHVHNNIDFSSYCNTESQWYLGFLGVLPTLKQYVERKHVQVFRMYLDVKKSCLILFQHIYNFVRMNRVLLFLWYFIGTCTIIYLIRNHNIKTFHTINRSPCDRFPPHWYFMLSIVAWYPVKLKIGVHFWPSNWVTILFLITKNNFPSSCMLYARFTMPVVLNSIAHSGWNSQWFKHVHFITFLTLRVQKLYSEFGKSLCTYKRCWKWCSRTIVSKQLHTLPVLHLSRCLTTEYSETSTATSILTTKSTYHSLSAQRLSERTVH